jgi:hypothetical protein
MGASPSTKPTECSHLFMRVIMVMIMMMVFGRTGRIIPLSTPRLAVIATTTLPQNHPPRNIHPQPRQLLPQRHGLA